MKLIYTLRVLFVSIEMLIIAISALIWMYLKSEVTQFLTLLQLDQDAAKYLMIAPIGLFVWIAAECRAILQDEKETVRLLTKWDDYWRLKTHIWVSIFFAALFSVCSIAPWITKSGVNNNFGFILFTTSLIGQIAVAAGVYSARIRIKELISHT